jgi:hypothetical protein
MRKTKKFVEHSLPCHTLENLGGLTRAFDDAYYLMPMMERPNL